MGDQIVTVATVGGTVVAVLTFLYLVRRYAKADATRVNQERKQIRDDAYAEGRASRDDEIQLLTSQRDDARHDRDQNGLRAAEFERRYNDLRDRGQH